MFTFPKPEFAETILGRQEVAKLLGVTDRTLQNWAARQFGPTPIVIGGAALYSKDQVETFRALATGGAE